MMIARWLIAAACALLLVGAGTYAYQQVAVHLRAQEAK
jgi:hypothetical protein